MASGFHSICIVGETGAEGHGLALRWAKHGHKVMIGSRDAAKARAAAAELQDGLPDGSLIGADSRDGVAQSDIAVLTVPFQAQIPTVTALKDVLAGKILVDVTVPVIPPKVSRFQLTETDYRGVPVQRL